MKSQREETIRGEETGPESPQPAGADPSLNTGGSVSSPIYFMENASPAQHRGILSARPLRERERGRFDLRVLSVVAVLCLVAIGIRASVVTGNVVSVGLAGISTKMSFYPTNLVQVTASGLSAGPPITITTATNGGFTNTLDAGDYVVSFPLIPWRKSFTISVLAGQTNNITNWMTTVYVYTNSLAEDSGATLLFD